jgi:hypothetical protein
VLLCSAAAALLAASPALAQLNRGSITGVVTDPTGAAIVSAKITVVHQQTNMTFGTTTTETGNYTLPGLDIGRYRVEAETSGFKRAVRDSVELSSGATVRVDLTLEIGQVTESVEVHAQT